MSKAKLLIFLGLVGIIAIIFSYRSQVSGLFSKLPDQQTLVSQIHSLIPINQIKKEIIVASPLRAYLEKQEYGSLSVNGIISLINIERSTNNMQVLTENEQLNSAAQLKLQDMFANQYFAHTSINGFGPSHWAEQAGYDYIVIGENLALGNYANDNELVQAWMASEGHRENILNPRFHDIGVAIGTGTFEGRVTWLAVQVFGKPAASCPTVDATLKNRITKQEQQLNIWQQALDAAKKAIDTIDQSDSTAYNQKIAEYNTLAAQYNTLSDSTKTLVIRYNAEVNLYNACATSN